MRRFCSAKVRAGARAMPGAVACLSAPKPFLHMDLVHPFLSGGDGKAEGENGQLKEKRKYE